MVGCHILVSTPVCLLKVILKGWTNLLRCCHLIITSADDSLEHFPEETSKIMGLYRATHKKNQTLTDQIVVTSGSWTTRMEQFSRAFLVGESQFGPVFGIADFLQVILGLEIIDSTLYSTTTYL